MSVTVPSKLLETILNGYLENESFIQGADLSKADSDIFAALPSAPNASTYPHLARWYSHVKSQAGSDALEAASAAQEEEEDEDIDLFGSDEEEDEEAERIKAERLAAYRERKAAKGPGPAAKSTIVYDIKPWDSETDMAELEKCVRSINMDGLLWGTSKLQPVAYGVMKLTITCTVVDDLVSTDILEEKIVDFEDYVQSVDIVSFQKI
ncbi:Elongation factor 1-beta [Zancudomyces culisetae]|uniref:Elongation factor 1-beta n=1 Tax=Zancudomyces culisetae TaxID=1213189 RepID=A0A1R1PIG5_ZANCU|nr:Elongation factor 1-beta [Zancudomyces culisetae]|eukprot:OMH80642.1 Elongation factor 1-beta [Zancudomyces culisetae]